MKIRYLVLAIIGAMVLSLGLVACGDDDDDNGGNGNGGGELTLAEYFSALEPLSQAFDADVDLLDAGESLDEFVGFVEDSKSLVDDFVGDLEGLNAPAEVADAHSEAVSAGQELVEMYDNALTVLDLSETVEDAQLVLQGPGFLGSQARFAASCVALQGIADSNGLDIDMRCPG
ncbi:MAG: hypothetical protein IIB88_05670 [Chloroflexi bacterium]|nr:hypothetical protein [Chloroflexota bacterium]